MIERFFIILIILLPLQFALNIGDNFDLVTTRIFIPILFLLWLVRGLAQRKVWISNKAEAWLIFSFLFLSAVSLVLGREAQMGVRKLLYLLTILPIFFVAADIFQDEKWRKRGFGAIIWSGSLAALVAFFQFSLPFLAGLEKAVKVWEDLAPYFLGNTFSKLVVANSSWLVNIGGVTRMRAFGFFPDPHNFAFFMNLCLFLGLGYFFSKIIPNLSWRETLPFAKGGRPQQSRSIKENAGLLSRQSVDHHNNRIAKILLGIDIILMLIAVVLSFSRGAYLGLVAGFIFFAIIFLKRSGELKKAIAIGGIIFFLVGIFNSGFVLQRLASSFNLKEGSNAERYKNWVQAVEIIRDNPLSGVGLGNYARAVDPAAKDRSSIYAHNLFLDIAAETGILNAIIFLSLMVVSMWRNIKNGSLPNLGLAAGLVGFLVHSIFDTALWSPQALTMLLVLIALGLYNNKLKSQNAKLKTTN